MFQGSAQPHEQSPTVLNCLSTIKFCAVKKPNHGLLNFDKCDNIGKIFQNCLYIIQFYVSESCRSSICLIGKYFLHKSGWAKAWLRKN